MIALIDFISKYWNILSAAGSTLFLVILVRMRSGTTQLLSHKIRRIFCSDTQNEDKNFNKYYNETLQIAVVNFEMNVRFNRYDEITRMHHVIEKYKLPNNIYYGLGGFFIPKYTKVKKESKRSTIKLLSVFLISLLFFLPAYIYIYANLDKIDLGILPLVNLYFYTILLSLWNLVSFFHLRKIGKANKVRKIIYKSIKDYKMKKSPN